MDQRINLITDIAGIRVGHAHDERLASGVTVCVFDRPVVASGIVVGGAPGGRETDLLDPSSLVQGVDAFVLSGGSTFGLDAGGGVQAYLREAGRGLTFAGQIVPLAPQAICFDLANGGDKDWGRYPPYREMGYEAAASAAGTFGLGTIGGGYGAQTVDLKGGVGSASIASSRGFMVGALVVVNAVASAIMGDGPHFWAAPYERDDEFGGLGLPRSITPAMQRLRWKGGGQPATTIAIVATDAALTKAQARRLAISASGGLHKGLRFAAGIIDGDTVFSAATGEKPLEDPVSDLLEIGALAGDCLARAIARGVYEAKALPFPGALPAWKDRFAGQSW